MDTTRTAGNAIRPANQNTWKKTPFFDWPLRNCPHPGIRNEQTTGRRTLLTPSKGLPLFFTVLKYAWHELKYQTRDPER